MNMIKVNIHISCDRCGGWMDEGWHATMGGICGSCADDLRALEDNDG